MMAWRVLSLSGTLPPSPMDLYRLKGHATVPHHGAEVLLEQVVAGVVAPGHVLAVVLLTAEYRGVSEALVGVDQAQLRVDQLPDVGRQAADAAAQQRLRDSEESHVLLAEIIQLRDVSIPLRQRGFEHQVGKLEDGRAQLVHLEDAERIVEQDVIGVQGSVRRDDGRGPGVHRIFVDVVDLRIFRRAQIEQVSRQRRSARRHRRRPRRARSPGWRASGSRSATASRSLPPARNRRTWS